MAEGFRNLNNDTNARQAVSNDLDTLYDLLLEDGALWQQDVPLMPSLDTKVRELAERVSRPMEGSVEVATKGSAVTSGVGVSRRSGRAGSMGKSRWSGMLAVAAMVLVVALIVAVFQARGKPTSSITIGGDKHPTATVTVPGNTGWQTLRALAYSSERPDDSGPAVAPSDPDVIYEANAGRDWTPADGPAFLRRTDDGGASWHSLPFPVPVTRVHAASFLVSSLDPQTVILQILDDTLSDCPTSFYVNYPGVYQMCDLQYFSSDGGGTWTLLHTPMSNLMSLDGTGISQDSALPHQGTHLYATVSCPNQSCSRLVVSTDGGHSWSLVDQQLFAATPYICDYYAAPTGQMLFATTANMSCPYSFRQPRAAFAIWRSNDGGITWARVATLPTQVFFGLLAVDSGNPAQPLLYAYMPKTLSVTTDKANLPQVNPSDQAKDIYVSSDGGTSWTAAPSAGLPAGYIPFRAPIAALSDGTIIASFNTQGTLGDNQDLNGSTLYGWKVGETVWHQIAPPLSEELMNLSIAPGSNGSDTLRVFEMNFNQGSIDVYTALRIQIPALAG